MAKDNEVTIPSEVVDYNDLVGKPKPQAKRSEDDTYPVDGILEVKQDYGVLRQDAEPKDPNTPKDVYVAQTQINKFGLRKGDRVEGNQKKVKGTFHY